MSDLLLRPADDAGWPAMAALDATAFGHTLPPGQLAAERAALDLGRSLGAYEGDRLVGVTASYALEMSVPGGTVLPVAGVTWVSVLPTHRRRGVASRLMRAQLDRLHAAGESVAALWASEPAIYGRFGYGGATRQLQLTVPRSAQPFAAGAPTDPALRLHLAERDEGVQVGSEVERRSAAARPGVVVRDRALRELTLLDPPEARAGRSALRCVVAGDPTGARGYAYYALEVRWQGGGPAGVVHVRELQAVDVSAAAALWRYLLDLDLTSSVVAPQRPLDDPLLDLLVDPRRAAPVLSDALHVRLVDVGTALGGRAYALPVDVVLDVRDDLCPWNARRWHLTGGPGGASCAPTGAPAELALGVAELGAAYLGDPVLARLARVGRVEELRPGALAGATRAFASDPLPWCPRTF